MLTSNWLTLAGKWPPVIADRFREGRAFLVGDTRTRYAADRSSRLDGFIAWRAKNASSEPERVARREREEPMIEEIESRQGNVHPSPPLGIIAVVFVMLFAASIATKSIITSFAPYPTPYLTIDQLQAHYQRFPDASRVVSFLQLCASIPLGINH